MTFFSDKPNPGTLFTRRQWVEGTGLGLALAGLPGLARSQTGSSTPTALKPASSTELQRVVDGFVRGAQTLKEGLMLDLPVLGDNPASVPVRAKVTLPMTAASYCEEMIIVAESNPYPLACRFNFTPHAGTAEVAVRLRLIQSQSIQALARMNDGRVLIARRHIDVTAGGCGM